LQNESESTQDDLVQSTTQYYIHGLRYEHGTTRIHKSSKTNTEVEVVCLANPTQELVIEANPTQELEVKTNYAQELATKTFEVQNAIA
jgi:hypothetical protein